MSGALQIQRLEGSRPGGLWDLFLDEAVVVDCEVALAVDALPCQLLVAERMVVGRHVGESDCPPQRMGCEPLSSVMVQFRLSTQETQDMATGEDPL